MEEVTRNLYIGDLDDNELVRGRPEELLVTYGGHGLSLEQAAREVGRPFAPAAGWKGYVEWLEPGA